MSSEIRLRNIFCKTPARKINRKRLKLMTYQHNLPVNAHRLSLEELYKRYQTNFNTGLSPIQVKRQRSVHGLNIIAPSKSKCRMLVYYMFYNCSAVLWISMFMLLLTAFTIFFIDDSHPWLDILAVIPILLIILLGIAFYGYYQEASYAKLSTMYSKFFPKYAAVIRDGVKIDINTEEMVVGDLILLQAGDTVAADVRIIQSSGMMVDESFITGEEDPQPAAPEMTDLDPLKTANLLFCGAKIVEGSGKGIVIACGNTTCLGQISKLQAELNMNVSPLQRDVIYFIRGSTYFAIAIGLIIFILCMVMQYYFFFCYVYCITIIIANVPKGVLVTMTASYVLAVKRMNQHNCICKNLKAIETLGRVSVLCADKTGTLTANDMIVSHMYFDGAILDITSPTFMPPDTLGFATLCLVATLCNRAKIEEVQDDFPTMDNISGGTEQTVLMCMENLTGRTTQEIKAEHSKIFEHPFSQTKKYQMSIHTLPEDSNRLYLVVKGAPEIIIQLCNWISLEDSTEELTDYKKRELRLILLQLTYLGERVLGFADLILPPDFTPDYKFTLDDESFLTDLRFVGFISIYDPPHPDIKQTIAKCKNAGVRMVMVTGDHPITAMTFAKKVGLISPQNDTVYDLALRRNISMSRISEGMAAQCRAAVISGNELSEMDPENLDNTISSYDELIFVRMNPQQKLQVVQAFQQAGCVVAVTGKSTKDSDVLQKADIGIAMANCESDAAKDAADIILVDDNLFSVVLSIGEGRLLYENLKKSLLYLLTSKCPEIAPFFLHIAIKIPSPVSVLSVLMIDLGADLWQSISFVYEAPEADIMTHSLQTANRERLITMRMIYYSNLIIGVVHTLSGLSCWYFVMAEYGFLPTTLFGISTLWLSQANDVLDSYNVEWSKYERNELACKGYSAYFLGVILTQVAVCLVAKTRRRSIIQQGMGNTVMNFGLLFELALALAFVYCPYVNTFLGFSPLQIYIMAPALPFAMGIVVFDELRKAFIRWRPGGWCERELYI